MKTYEFSAFLTVRAETEKEATEIAQALEGPVLVNMPGGLKEVTFSLDDGSPELLDEEDEDGHE